MSTLPDPLPRKKSDARRASLIQATLDVIARDGVAAATVRTIAREAKVTQGLIRYYFRSKDDLIAAAYESHMQSLMQTAEDSLHGAGSAKCRLIRYLDTTLSKGVASPQQVGTWAAFFQILLHDDTLIIHHSQSYTQIRLRTKTLMSDVFVEEGISKSDSELRRLSISGCALLHGLWIEGGAIGDSFHPGELSRAGLESFGALMGVDLKGHRDRKKGCGPDH